MLNLRNYYVEDLQGNNIVRHVDSNLSESEIKPDNFDISLQQKVRGENH